MKLTVTTVGIPASLAVFLLFAFFRLLEVRKRTAVAQDKDVVVR